MDDIYFTVGKLDAGGKGSYQLAVLKWCILQVRKVRD
jgi:hypothetical protein